MSYKKVFIPEEIVLSSDSDDDNNLIADDKVISLDVDSDEAEILSVPIPLSPSILNPKSCEDPLDSKTEIAVINAVTEEEMILPDICSDNNAEIVPPSENQLYGNDSMETENITKSVPEDVVSSPVVTSTNRTEIVISEPVQNSVMLESSVVLNVSDINGEAKTDAVVNADDETNIETINNTDVETKQIVQAQTFECFNTDPPKPATSMAKLVRVVKKRLSKSEFDQVETKLWRCYGKLEFSTPEFENDVHRAIEGCAHQLLLKSENKWKELLGLLNYLRKCKKNPKASAGGIAPKQDKALIEAKKQKKIEQLEKKLELCEKTIEKWDKKDKKWDDDVNSPYLVKNRLVKRYMKTYETLCKVTGCNTNTGRPTQKKISIRGVSRYPELNSAVEKLLNSKGVLFVPDYHDMLNIAKSVNIIHSLHLSPDELHEIALDIFQKVVRMLRERRLQDFNIAVRIADDELTDPAENDVELQRKLEENKLNRRTEEAVVKEFAIKQNELKLAAKEVFDENPDDSAKESDDEDSEDDETDEVEIDDEDDTQLSDDSSRENNENGHSSRPKRPASPTINLEESDSESTSSVCLDIVLEENGSNNGSKKPRLELAN